jgi:hypothetical protein
MSIIVWRVEFYLPHPLCPSLLQRRGGGKERGAGAPLKLPCPLYESGLRDYNIMVCINSENTAGGENWLLYM